MQDKYMYVITTSVTSVLHRTFIIIEHILYM